MNENKTLLTEVCGVPVLFKQTRMYGVIMCCSCQQPQQVPKVSSLWFLSNVGKGSRQIGSATLEKGLALRAGHWGPCQYIGIALLLHACYV